MEESKLPFSLTTVSFGAQPRRLLAAVIVEGIALTGLLQFNASGLIDITVFPRYLLAVSVIGIFAIGMTFLFAHRMSKASYSPLLHRKYAFLLVAVGYLMLGWVATGIGSIVHLLLLPNPTAIGASDGIFGLSLGAIFGFLILLYIDRYGVELPEHRGELEDAIDSIQETITEINTSNRAPVQMTATFESLTESMDRAVDLLNDGPTEGGRELRQDMRNWLSAFREKPEVSQAAIVDSSRGIQEQELRKLQEAFESIIERLERISHHE